jgi:uncharacterized sporulation protein YeaH/YhbH (DUF444 family)
MQLRQFIRNEILREYFITKTRKRQPRATNDKIVDPKHSPYKALGKGIPWLIQRFEDIDRESLKVQDYDDEKFDPYADSSAEPGDVWAYNQYKQNTKGFCGAERRPVVVDVGFVGY